MIFLRNLRKNIRYFEVFLVIIFEVSISPLRCSYRKKLVPVTTLTNQSKHK